MRMTQFGSCNRSGGDEKCIKNFSPKTSRKETI